MSTYTDSKPHPPTTLHQRGNALEPSKSSASASQELRISSEAQYPWEAEAKKEFFQSSTFPRPGAPPSASAPRFATDVVCGIDAKTASDLKNGAASKQKGQISMTDFLGRKPSKTSTSHSYGPEASELLSSSTGRSELKPCNDPHQADSRTKVHDKLPSCSTHSTRGAQASTSSLAKTPKIEHSRPPMPSERKQESPHEPYQYLHDILSTGALHPGKLPQVRIKGLVSTVTSFSFEETGEYKLVVMVEDGTASTTVRFANHVTADIAGHTCLEFSRLDEVSRGRVLERMERRIANLEGIMTLQPPPSGGHDELPIITSLSKITISHTYALLRRVRRRLARQTMSSGILHRHMIN